MKAPPRVLTVSLTSDSELEELVPKRRCWEAESINFMGKDLKDIVHPHEDALVVKLWIGDLMLKES